MCGFAGFLDRHLHSDSTEWPNVLGRMGDAIKHRGPNEAGIWVDPQNGIGLAHRRLSILEISQAGSQPMVSPCGQYIIVFNGEIYNHKTLRLELESEGGAFKWVGKSDTETLLAGLRHWGVELCLKKLVGMFAFALWNRNEKTLFLGRDRMGEKPLYYGYAGDFFLFGSELKALAAHFSWHGDIDREALTQFLRYGYVPSPNSIYRGIFKLPPAHFIKISAGNSMVQQLVCYWNLSHVAEQSASPLTQRKEVLVNELDAILRQAVTKQMVADVPLGAFLSGGYDSTTIVAIMQQESTTPIKTFSIGFNEVGFNEAIHAKKVAKHLGTDHSEVYVTSNEALSVIPKLPTIYDEPFADVSQIPTYLVSQLARKHVVVSLSGDGGDELFCGYNRYLSGFDYWKKVSRLPQPVRNILADLFGRLPVCALNGIQNLLPTEMQLTTLSGRLPKLADVIAAQDVFTYYHSIVSHVKSPSTLVLEGSEPPNFLDKYKKINLPSFQEQMMFWDMSSYLPDDILTKLDRASMAVSLETRVPFLDHRVVEFAWRLPINLKCYNGQGKWLLRQVLYRYVPKELMDRPKMGFGVPISNWLRGPLRDWAEFLLDEKRLKQQGYLNPVPISFMWKEFLFGRRNLHQQLWHLLMFQAWVEKLHSK